MSMQPRTNLGVSVDFLPRRPGRFRFRREGQSLYLTMEPPPPLTRRPPPCTNFHAVSCPSPVPPLNPPLYPLIRFSMLFMEGAGLSSFVSGPNKGSFTKVPKQLPPPPLDPPVLPTVTALSHDESWVPPPPPPTAKKISVLVDLSVILLGFPSFPVAVDTVGALAPVPTVKE